MRLLGGLVILAFCWSHVRRDFIECAAGQVELTQWCQGWIELIASLYRLNEARLEHYDPGVQRQTPAFDAAQGALEEALDGLFAQAARELAGLPDEAREGKALRSLLNHREGLSVFVDRSQVPMDNNLAERFLSLDSAVAGVGRPFLGVDFSPPARPEAVGARADAPAGGHGGTSSALPPGSGASDPRRSTAPHFAPGSGRSR